MTAAPCPFANLKPNKNWAKLPLFDRKGWKRVRFGDVVRQLKEETAPLADGVERYVAGEHMETENVHIRKWGTVGDGYLGPAFIRKFHKGHVLYGSRRTYLKKVAVAEWDGVTANTTFVLEAIEGRVLQELLPWLMLSERFTKHSVQESKGSTNPYINFPDIAKFEFDLPPLDRQRRIAEILCAVDDTIQEYLKALQACEQWKIALVERCFLNSEFPHIRLEKAITAIIAGKSVNGVNETTSDGEFGVLKVSAVGPKGFDPAEHKRLIAQENFLPRFAVRQGDFLITRCNTRELVGRVCIVPQDYPSLMLCDKTIKLGFNPDTASPAFMEAILKSRALRKQIEARATGTGGAMKNISQDDIRSLTVPMPKISKQLELQKRLENANVVRIGLESAAKAAMTMQATIGNSIFI